MARITETFEIGVLSSAFTTEDSENPMQISTDTTGSGRGNILQSTNYSTDDTMSVASYTFTTGAVGTVTFDYNLSSEIGWDNFYVLFDKYISTAMPLTSNGIYMVDQPDIGVSAFMRDCDQSGNIIYTPSQLPTGVTASFAGGLVTGNTGDSLSQWNEVTLNNVAVGTHKLIFVYLKDNGGLSGRDNVLIDNISYEVNCVTDGLQLYLDAKDYPSTSTNFIWTDKSGNANDASLNGFGFNGSTSGWTGDSLALDGINDYIALSGMPTASVYTIERVFSQRSAAVTTLFYVDGTGTVSCYVNGFGTPYAWLITSAGASVKLNSDTSITIGTKMVLHLVVGASSARMYLNGVLVGTLAETFRAGQLLYLDRDPEGYYFNGSDYGTKYYSRELTDAEITQNYNDVMGIGGGSGTNNLGGTIASVLGASATLKVTRSLTGTIASSSSTSATLKVIKPLAGSITSTLSASASLTNTSANSLSGAIASTSAISANLLVTKPLSGSISTSTSTSASLAVTKALSGSIASSASVQSTLLQNHALSGNAGASASITANLTVLAGLSFTGSITATSSASASLSKTVNLSANVGVSSVVQATLSSIVSLSGSSVSASTVSGNITKIVNLIASATSTTSASANLSAIPAVYLNGSISAVANTQANIGVVKPLSGSVNATTTIVAYINLPVIIFAEINAVLERSFNIDGTLGREYVLTNTLENSFEQNLYYSRGWSLDNNYSR